MERLNEELFSRTALRDEHTHRYEFAARLARGQVVDCACGMGYAAAIISKQTDVTAYEGIDPSQEAVAIALKHFASPSVHFSLGTLEDNRCGPASADTFLMFETLEHTVDPAQALAGVARVLKPDGLLIGSVPSAEYESMCEDVYGANPYHLQRFTRAQLIAALNQQFESVELFAAEFILGSLVTPIGAEPATESVNGHIDLSSRDQDSVAGSFIFIAGQSGPVARAISRIGAWPRFYPSVPKVEADREEVEPLRAAFHQAEAAIASRDAAMADQARMLEQRWDIMQAYEQKLQSLETRISASRLALRSATRRRAMLRTLADVASRRCGRVALMEEMLHRHQGPFSELALSLYAFTERLYQALERDGVADVFFFAREGQPLKEMFDFYCSLSPARAQIRSHYLRVSRRSTFLLSLGPLNEENFDVLFRQYRAISLRGFLRSLDLDEHVTDLASALGTDVASFDQTRADLPSDSLFLKLLALDQFGERYEAARKERGDAFRLYLGSFFEQRDVPTDLHVVDVGWKGSIQDNVFNWLRRTHGGAAKVHGYYVGLVAPGGMTGQNLKEGLLFSNLNGRTRGFTVFNENRSLFEMILHADHGSAARYVRDEEGKPYVREDDYAERDMIDERIVPVSRVINAAFRELSELGVDLPVDRAELLDLAARHHARMVFNPTRHEIDWILSVGHVENFGVFQQSSFEPEASRASAMSRIQFTTALLMRRRPAALGFWPWLSIHAQALPGLDKLYARFRLWQSRKPRKPE